VRVLADGQTHTHTQTDRPTDANRFYNLSHAICYSYGTDKNKVPNNVVFDAKETVCLHRMPQRKRRQIKHTDMILWYDGVLLTILKRLRKAEPKYNLAMNS